MDETVAAFDQRMTRFESMLSSALNPLPDGLGAAGRSQQVVCGPSKAACRLLSDAKHQWTRYCEVNTRKQWFEGPIEFDRAGRTRGAKFFRSGSVFGLRSLLIFELSGQSCFLVLFCVLLQNRLLLFAYAVAALWPTALEVPGVPASRFHALIDAVSVSAGLSAQKA